MSKALSRLSRLNKLIDALYNLITIKSQSLSKPISPATNHPRASEDLEIFLWKGFQKSDSRGTRAIFKIRLLRGRGRI